MIIPKLEIGLYLLENKAHTLQKALRTSHNKELYSIYTPTLLIIKVLKISVCPWPVHHMCLFSICFLSVEYPFPHHSSLFKTFKAQFRANYSSTFLSYPSFLALLQYTAVSLVFLNSFVYNPHNSYHSTLYYTSLYFLVSSQPGY